MYYLKVPNSFWYSGTTPKLCLVHLGRYLNLLFFGLRPDCSSTTNPNYTQTSLPDSYSDPLCRCKRVLPWFPEWVRTTENGPFHTLGVLELKRSRLEEFTVTRGPRELLTQLHRQTLTRKECPRAYEYHARHLTWDA